MNLIVVTPPQPIVAPADMRARLRLDETYDDSLLSGLIAAATSLLDGPNGWLGRALGLQVIELDFDRFSWGDGIALPCPPVVEVQQIEYDDLIGVPQILSSATYGVRAGRVYLKPGATWPATYARVGSVRVRYQAGYDEVPAPILSAIALGVRELITTTAQDPALRSEQVEGVLSRTWTISADTSTPLRQAADRLLAPYRVFA